jgi:hypothetical protein
VLLNLRLRVTDEVKWTVHVEFAENHAGNLLRECRVPSTSAVMSAESPTYESISKSFRTGRLEGELQMVQLSATRCSCIAIL